MQIKKKKKKSDKEIADWEAKYENFMHKIDMIHMSRRREILP